MKFAKFKLRVFV